MKNLSVDNIPHDEQDDAKLFELLSKEAAEAGGEKPADNEHEGTVGTTGLYPSPEDRGEGTVDAPWGEKDGRLIDGKHQPNHHSNGAYAEFKKGREELLSRIFDGKGSSDKTEQGLISQSFSHGASGDFSTSSPQLSGKAKEASQHETLLDRTRRLVGMP